MTFAAMDATSSQTPERHVAVHCGGCGSLNEAREASLVIGRPSSDD